MEGGGGGAKAYDGEKALSSINHYSCLARGLCWSKNVPHEDLGFKIKLFLSKNDKNVHP